MRYETDAGFKVSMWEGRGVGVTGAFGPTGYSEGYNISGGFKGPNTLSIPKYQYSTSSVGLDPTGTFNINPTKAGFEATVNFSTTKLLYDGSK